MPANTEGLRVSTTRPSDEDVEGLQPPVNATTSATASSTTTATDATILATPSATDGHIQIQDRPERSRDGRLSPTIPALSGHFNYQNSDDRQLYNSKGNRRREHPPRTTTYTNTSKRNMHDMNINTYTSIPTRGRRPHKLSSPLTRSPRLRRPSDPDMFDADRLKELLRTMEISRTSTNQNTSQDTQQDGCRHIVQMSDEANNVPGAAKVAQREKRLTQTGSGSVTPKHSSRERRLLGSASFDFSTHLPEVNRNGSAENIKQHHQARLGRHQRNMSSVSNGQFDIAASPRASPPPVRKPRVLRSQSVSAQDAPIVAIGNPNSARSVVGVAECITEREEHGLPLLHLTEAERKENLLQAVCFVDDALNGRNFYHRIDEFGLKWYYSIYYHPYTSNFVRLCSILYLLTPLVDKSHPTVALCVDQIIICVIAAYTILKCLLCGNAKFFFRHWDIVCSLAILVSEADLMAEMMGFASSSDVRIRRYVKPVFFVCFSSWLKATIKNVARTAIKVLPLLGILTYFILFMAVLGLILFSGIPEGKESFSNPLNATMSLVVLLTTANHPDVMMPFYASNPYYAAFFVVFLLIATFFLLNIATAHMYYHFRGFLKSSLSNRRLRHHAGIRAAFELLDMLSPEQKDAVDVGTVRRFVCMVADLQQYQPFIEQMLDSHDRKYINFDEFYILANIPRQLSVEVTTPEIPSPWGYNEFSFKMLDIVQSSVFGIIQDIMMGAGWIWSILSVFNSLGILGIDVHFHVASLFLVSFYPIEILILVIGYGPRYYFMRNRWHTWDLLLAAIFFILRAGFVTLFDASNSEHADYRWQLFCLLMFGWQSLRISRQVPVLRIYIGVISNIMRSLFSNDTALFSYVLLFFYGFATLGHDLFAGTVTRDNPLVAHTEYARLDYWPNNFDDIPSSMMTLWELMVVNNWFIIMEAYVAATSQWARVYFIAWYAVSVILIFNLLVAFILDTFIVKWDQMLGKQKEGAAKRNLIRSVSSIHGNSGHFKFGATETHHLKRREDYCYTIQSDDPFGNDDTNDPTEFRIIEMLRRHEELWLKISEVVSVLEEDDIQNWERREAHRFSEVDL